MNGNTVFTNAYTGQEERALAMLHRLVDAIKQEATHEGVGGMSPADLLNKIVGLAHEYNLPEIREKALER